MKRGLLRFNVLRSAHLNFCATDLCRGSVVDFCFMFTKVLMKDVELKLIHVRKIFNCRYLSICFFQCASYLLGRNFEHSSRSSNIDQVTFKMPLSQKMPWQWRKSFSPKRPFLPLVLIKNNNNKHAEYHGIFILFKGQIYWKQGSHISLLFGT